MTRSFERARERAVVLLCAEHVQSAPPTDFGPGFTLHDAFAGIVREILDRLDDPDVRNRLDRLTNQEY